MNTAAGLKALYKNKSGRDNTALGADAGSALTTGSDNVDIANEGVKAESGTIRIGTSGTQRRTFLAGISGASISGPTKTVLVNAQGQLGTAGTASIAKSGRRPLSAAAGRRLLAEVNRLQRRDRRQDKEIRELRAQN